MIHASRIDRLVRAGRFEQLLDEVLTNGRRLPIAARAMLLDDRSRGSGDLRDSGDSREDAACVSAAVSLGVLERASMGLALQRLVELTYVPHPLALGLARRLVAGLSHRGRDGEALMGGGLAARVMAVAGLVDLVDQCVQTREASGMESLGVEIDALIDELGCELSHAVAQSVATRGARGEGLVCGCALSTCLIVWQLRPRDVVRELAAVCECGGDPSGAAAAGLVARWRLCGGVGAGGRGDDGGDGGGNDGTLGACGCGGRCSRRRLAGGVSARLDVGGHWPQVWVASWAEFDGPTCVVRWSVCSAGDWAFGWFQEILKDQSGGRILDHE